MKHKTLSSLLLESGAFFLHLFSNVDKFQQIYSGILIVSNCHPPWYLVSECVGLHGSNGNKMAITP